MKDWKWVVGVDYSMSCPSITIVKNGDFVFENCRSYYIADKAVNKALPNVESSRLEAFSNNEERFDRISNWAVRCITEAVEDLGDVKVFMEGYAMGAKGQVFQIGENTGLLKHKLWRIGLPVTLIAPTVVKKQATGKGNAKKEGMYEAFVKRTGVELMKLYQPKAKVVGSPVGDIVDSYFVALCGYEGVGLNSDG